MVFRKIGMTITTMLPASMKVPRISSVRLMITMPAHGGSGSPVMKYCVVGTTPGFNGDYKKALRAIKAKVLVMAGSGDLLNPEYESKEAASYITDVRYVALNETRPMGHVSAAGISARENELQNAEIAKFLRTYDRTSGR